MHEKKVSGNKIIRRGKLVSRPVSASFLLNDNNPVIWKQTKSTLRIYENQLFLVFKHYYTQIYINI